VADDDSFQGIHTVRADDFGARDHRQLTQVDVSGSTDGSAESPCDLCIATTQHDKDAAAEPNGINRRSESGPALTSHHQIDPSAHASTLTTQSREKIERTR
jgi:hypothetical protein